MKMLRVNLSRMLMIACWVIIQSCSKSEDSPQVQILTVNFSQPTGEYKVKAGYQTTLEAVVEKAINPVYSWKLGGKIISTELTCDFSGSSVGEYFVNFRVDAENGSVEKQVKVSVLEKLAPEIDMSSSVIAYLNIEKEVTANVLYADDAAYLWRLNGETISQTDACNVLATKMGQQVLSLKVTNEDGSDYKQITVNVFPEPRPAMFFDDGRYRLLTDLNRRVRLSVPLGRKLVLAPVIMNFEGKDAIFSWTVDGSTQSSTGEYFTFEPTAKGTYKIVVTARVNGETTEAEVDVECVDEEGTFFRQKTAASNREATKAFQYIQAPGQYTNYQDGSSEEQARADLEAKMGKGSTSYISLLGAFGGYYIVGFEHSVKNIEGKGDLAIYGNAMPSWSEPGTVWVMQDENGNGLPDDTWYELKGSATLDEGTKRRYALTYYKPTEPGGIVWTDNLMETGAIDRNGYHTQRSYFPMFIEGDYVLTGTCLGATVEFGSIVTSTGYAWGYVDNYGDSSIRPNWEFWIEDAIQVDGTPIHLEYIDFVKVQTAMNSMAGALGEISTEASAPFDLNF